MKKETSPKDRCRQDLQVRILSLDIAPGSDLDEAQLCDQYALSRTPLREVLQRLGGEGYLTLQQNRGAKVASMDLSRMRMFFQTAPLVYANIARQAAEHRAPRDLDAMQAAQSRFADATGKGDAGAAALANHAFHDAIGIAAQNPYLYAALGRMLIDHTRLSQTFYRPASDSEATRVAKACAQHDAMIAAISEQDADAVVGLTLEHWDLSRDQMERYVRPDPLPHDLVEARSAV